MLIFIWILTCILLEMNPMIVLWIADIASCIGLIFVCHSTKWGFNNKLQSIFPFSSATSL